jgi:hypothetical protein
MATERKESGMKLKWVKGHNGQRRKLARAVARMETAYKNGATFDDVMAIYKPVSGIAKTLKRCGDIGAKYHDAAFELIEDMWFIESSLGWWRSVGVNPNELILDGTSSDDVVLG